MLFCREILFSVILWLWKYGLNVFSAVLFIKGRVKIAETKPRNNNNRYLRSNFDSSEKNEDNVQNKSELHTIQQIPQRFPKQWLYRTSQR